MDGGDDDRDSTQLSFQDGELVVATEGNDRGTHGPRTTMQPGAGAGYAVLAKPGALQVNSLLADAVDSHGQPLEFGSRRQVERYVDHLSAADGGVRLQRVAPNDPAEVDAYLLGAHDPSVAEPATIDGDIWTFDVGANLYGALGEAILLEAPKPHALYYFVRRDLDIASGQLDDGLSLDVKRDPSIITTESGHTWLPDCVVVATDGVDGRTLKSYYCEIKTGEASFGPGQRETMQRLASDEPVLAIRVVLADLPAQYAVRIHEVEPSGEG